MRRFYPKKVYASVYDIPFEALAARGLKGIIFDIDNTLVYHGAPADDRALCLFESLKTLGIRTCLLSNNKEMRVASFADKVASPYIYKGGKPGKKGYLRAIKMMGTGKGDTIFVGDQIFTDIYGANRTGIYSVLVHPLNPREEIQIVLKRRLEAVILYFYEREQRRKNHD